MLHEASVRPPAGRSASRVEKIMPLLSTVTLLMRLPQVWTVWRDHAVAGVSLLSWGTYLLAACPWFVHGLQKLKSIYLACIGWIVPDAAVVAGVLVYR